MDFNYHGDYPLKYRTKPVMENSKLSKNKGQFSAENLECIRSDRLLFSRLSFSLDSGEMLHVEGENGSGKTSLLRILCGLSPPASGEIYWQGNTVRKNRTRFLENIAYIGHHAGIKGELTPLENLALVLKLHPTHSKADLSQILADVGLYGHEDVPARTLSAGQRQRIALARLLLQKAILWILDEPFTSLDVKGRAWLQDLLDHHLQRGGMIILTAHHLLESSRPMRRLCLNEYQS